MTGTLSCPLRGLGRRGGVALGLVAILASGGCDIQGERSQGRVARAQRAVEKQYGLKAARFGPAMAGTARDVACGVVTGQDTEGLVAERPYIANGELGVALMPNLTRITGPVRVTASPLSEPLTGACEFIGLWRQMCLTPPPAALARAAATCGPRR